MQIGSATCSSYSRSSCEQQKSSSTSLHPHHYFSATSLPSSGSKDKPATYDCCSPTTAASPSSRRGSLSNRSKQKWWAEITHIDWKEGTPMQVSSYRIETRTRRLFEQVPCEARGGDEYDDFELDIATDSENEEGVVCAVVNRSYWECARTHRVLSRFYEEATGSRLAFPSVSPFALRSHEPTAKKHNIEHQRIQLQTWLDSILSLDMFNNEENPTSICHSAVWRLLGYPCAKSETSQTPLANIPLVDHVTGFLDHPNDIASLCAVNHATWNTIRPHLDMAWKICLQNRWPAIYDALVANQNLDWRQAWRQILSGGEMLVGVHERQMKRGFAMSCMPAWLSWEKNNKSFRVVYLSGLTMTPTEYIGPDAFQRLAKMRGDPYAAYPSDPLESFEPGKPVAVQWKMLRNGPFGWWYGTLHEISMINGVWTADVRFMHIVDNSRWHQLYIPVGSKHPTEAHQAGGGFTGGIIKVQESDDVVWKRFWPARPMILS